MAAPRLVDLLSMAVPAPLRCDETALDVLLRSAAQRHRVSFGVPLLDAVASTGAGAGGRPAGIAAGRVVELLGCSGAGKSRVATVAVARALLSTAAPGVDGAGEGGGAFGRAHVVVLDADGRFDAALLADVLRREYANGGGRAADAVTAGGGAAGTTDLPPPLPATLPASFLDDCLARCVVAVPRCTADVTAAMEALAVSAQPLLLAAPSAASPGGDGGGGANGGGDGGTVVSAPAATNPPPPPPCGPGPRRADVIAAALAARTRCGPVVLLVVEAAGSAFWWQDKAWGVAGGGGGGGGGADVVREHGARQAAALRAMGDRWGTRAIFTRRLMFAGGGGGGGVGPGGGRAGAPPVTSRDVAVLREALGAPGPELARAIAAAATALQGGGGGGGGSGGGSGGGGVAGAASAGAAASAPLPPPLAPVRTLRAGPSVPGAIGTGCEAGDDGSGGGRPVAAVPLSGASAAAFAELVRTTLPPALARAVTATVLLTAVAVPMGHAAAASGATLLLLRTLARGDGGAAATAGGRAPGSHAAADAGAAGGAGAPSHRIVEAAAWVR